MSQNSRFTRRALLGTAAAGALIPPARAQSQTVKIGVLNDMSGPYRDDTGMGSVVCTRQAAEEFGSGHGFTAEVLFADHQNKPDVGASIARQWFDRDGVDMIMDVPTSSVALAVASVCREKNKAYVNSGAGTTELTGKQCSPNTIHWTYNTYMLAKSTGGAMVKNGGTSWFFITANYVFGHNLRDATARFVKEAGGKVLGDTEYAFPGTTDFSSYLVQAQSSGAKVLGLANAGDDTENCIKQAHEFGLNSTMRLAALLFGIRDVHGIGLNTAQGLMLTESFYWNLNDRTRAFTNRVKGKMPSGVPNMIQTGCYSGTLHYLKAVAQLGAARAKSDGAATIAAMKAMPVEDDAFHGSIRADGQLLVPSYLFRVKAPAESKQPWDYYDLAATTPADQAWQPQDPACSLVHA